MTPFEDLIAALSRAMDIPLQVDPHQACRLEFNDGVIVQIDLDHHGDRILIGSRLGRLSAGNYREKILHQAMRVNGLSQTPRGTLAFSEKKDELILFQYFPLTISGDHLARFIELFEVHARAWKEAIDRGEIPQIEGERAQGRA